MFYHKKDYFKYLGDTPTLNELTNHFKVQPKAIKKLEAYGLVKILDKGDEKVVIIYRQQILAAGCYVPHTYRSISVIYPVNHQGAFIPNALKSAQQKKKKKGRLSSAIVVCANVPFNNGSRPYVPYSASN